MSAMDNVHYNIKIDKNRYRNDSLSYALVLLGLLVNVFYFISMFKINNNAIYKISLGASVIYNLIFMLLVFLSAEQIKTYKIGYSILLIVIGVLQIVRIFILPTRFAAMIVEEKRLLGDAQFVRMVIYLITSGALLVAGGILSAFKSKQLTQYIKRIEQEDAECLATDAKQQQEIDE